MPILRLCRLSDPDPFQDYSVYNADYSSIPPERFDSIWNRLLELRDERYARVVGGYGFGGP